MTDKISLISDKRHKFLCLSIYQFFGYLFERNIGTDRKDFFSTFGGKINLVVVVGTERVVRSR